jgi:hypothetical protein
MSTHALRPYFERLFTDCFRSHLTPSGTTCIARLDTDWRSLLSWHGCFLSVQNNTLGHTIGSFTGMGKWRNGEYFHQQALWPEYVFGLFLPISLTNSTHSIIHHTLLVSLTSMSQLRLGSGLTYLLKLSQHHKATLSPLLTSRAHSHGNFLFPPW